MADMVSGDQSDVLDIQAMVAEFNALGYPYTLRQVQRMVSTRKIPTFIGIDGRKRFIRRADFYRVVQAIANPAADPGR